METPIVINVPLTDKGMNEFFPAAKAGLSDAEKLQWVTELLNAVFAAFAETDQEVKIVVVKEETEE